jgi:hypothetical protein
VPTVNSGDKKYKAFYVDGAKLNKYRLSVPSENLQRFVGKNDLCYSDIQIIGKSEAHILIVRDRILGTSWLSKWRIAMARCSTLLHSRS